MSTLIIAAHPDDEVLGAGGWMAKHPGCKVAILSEGTSSQPVTAMMLKGYDDRLAAKRQATKNAAALLKAEVVYEGEFLDQQLAITNQELHRVVTDLLTTHQPTTILTHHPHELNADHRIVAEVVSVACRSFTPIGRIVRHVLAFSVDAWAMPGFASPAAYSMLLGLMDWHLQAKLDAIACYKDELRPWPHPRNLEAIRAYHRWLGAVAGRDYAEPYMLLWGRA